MSILDDKSIIDLFFRRSEEAISRCAEKYGAYCGKICMNILCDSQDSEECLNDAWLSAWNAIPPQRPDSLGAFLGRIARNLALNRLDMRTAAKRRGDTVPLEELAECIPDSRAADSADARELGRMISAFLKIQPESARRVFVCRYFYCDSVRDIALRFGFGEGKVKSLLFRTRLGLKKYLEGEGILL